MNKFKKSIRYMFKLYNLVQNKNMKTIITCLEVFFGRMLDVSIGSVRTILLVKGKSLVATILAFIEILIWFFIARETLTKDANMIVILSYAAGYASGTYVGGLINKYFVRGDLMAFLVTDIENTHLVEKLKSAGYGVSVIRSDGGKLILMMEFKKKNLKHLQALVKKLDKKAFLVINESLHVENGYMP